MRQGFEIPASELKHSKTNWLIIPPFLWDVTFTLEIQNVLTFYWSTHDNILLMGDFNTTLDNSNFNELIGDHELSSLISEPTYFKSINPTCIDNFLPSRQILVTRTSQGRS